MKKQFTSRSAFFNPHVFFLALLGFCAFSALAASMAQAQQKDKSTTKSIIQLVPPGFDCASLRALGIDKQENLRAGALMIFCGQAVGGSASAFGETSPFVQELLAPLFGAADVDLVTGAEISPNITQSETFTAANPDNPDEIVVAYNDSRGINANPINISGASVSTDGGNTFTRLTRANGQSPFSNTFGDPVALYNRPTGTWFTVWLDAASGGQGLGGYKSTNPSDPNSWTHFTVHNNSADDRESGWADNNPSSPFYGRMYISWNDFNVGGGALRVTFSIDNGATWHSPVTVSNTGTFVRNVQITGDLGGNGVVYIAGMDEGGGGFPHNDNNLIFKSTDGGATWTNTYTGPSFPGPGRTTCPNPYFACMYTDTGGYWRHEGWGEPAAYNNVVHLVYAQRGAGSDPGDVFYIRSTDGGVTFGAPLKLNTDATTRAQWQPNLSVSPTGTLLSVWYDERATANCQKGNRAVPCYQMWARKSNDNGASWLADEPFSDVVTPLPGQPDPNIIAEYAGDYDYGSALVTKHLSAWADGRVPIGGQSQQDAFTDRELVGFAVTSTDPACNSVISTQPMDFVVNVTDPVKPGTLQGSDFTVNGTPANTVNYTPGTTTMTFHFNSSPVLTQGVQTMHIPAGAFNRASDNQPNFEFLCTFRYDVLLLQVVSTVPPDGGTFSPPAPNDYQYDVNFNEPLDPASVQTSDLTVTGNSAPSVTAVSVINANMTARFTLHMTFGGVLTANIAGGAITDQFGNPGATFSGNYTVEGCPPSQYVITPGTDTIVRGTTDTGNHIDDGDTLVPLPFPFQLYDQTYNAVNVNSNGRLDFVCANEPGGYLTACLPAPANVCPYDFTIFGLWEDMRTDFGLRGCASFPGGNCGVFTSVSGSAPNRIFNIEWRTVLFNDNNATQNFEVRLYENPAENLRFDVIFGTLNPVNANHPWVSGVQGADTFVTQDFCIDPPGSPPENESRTYEIQTCGTGTLNLLSAASVKGPFAIDLPLTGTPGIEDRIGGLRRLYEIVLTFNNIITSVDDVATSCGTVQRATVDSGDAHRLSVNLVGVTCTAEDVTITLTGVHDDQGGTLDTSLTFGLLVSDATGNGIVNSADVRLTQDALGQDTNSHNFRADVNEDGRITRADVTIVKAQLGNRLP